MVIKLWHISAAVTATALTLSISNAYSQNTKQQIDLGKREFESNCASCHGTTGKGNGAIMDLLTKTPPDLTQLAKKNGGVLPVARLYEIIDGRGIRAHGTSDMPVWGQEYKTRAAEYYFDVPYDPEAFVRSRILMLIDYLNRIQVK